MKKFIAMSATALLLAQNPVFAVAAENATVKSVRVSAGSIYINTDKPVQYKAFTTGQPPKLVVELMDSRMQTLQEIPVNSGTLLRVRTGQFQAGISRVVMELTQKTAYEVTRKGTELIVMLGERSRKASAPAVKDAAAEVPSGVKVIVPDAAAPAPEKPIEMTLEAAPIKPADLKRESAPVITPKRTSAPASSSRNILDNLPREPISFDYNEADVREVLDMMAAKAGINMIYGDDVSGTVTISLSKVPYDEAFKTLLNVKGLAAQQVGDNILRIAAPSTFVAEQKKAMPQTRVFFLSYAAAADVKTQVESVASAEGRSAAKCTADETNNALIVTDTPLGLDSTERLIRSLDRIPKQVLIEAKLVEVTLDDSLDYGISWSGYGNKSGSYIGSQDVSATPTEALGGKYVSNTGLSATKGGTGVSLPASNIYGAFRLGKVASNYAFDATITAAAKKGKAKVLSDPKVATLNNKEANINITSQIPYTTTETSATTPPVSTTKVVYLTTGIILKVTPTINSDGRISMKINPSVSQASSSITPASGGAPGVDTRSADTTIIVRNGETVVIGGLIHDSQSDYVYKVPILGDIPLLGYLFKKKSTTRSRMELLIFVTPKIIED